MNPRSGYILVIYDPELFCVFYNRICVYCANYGSDFGAFYALMYLSYFCKSIEVGVFDL